MFELGDGVLETGGRWSRAELGADVGGEVCGSCGGVVDPGRGGGCGEKAGVDTRDWWP